MQREGEIQESQERRGKDDRRRGKERKGKSLGEESDERVEKIMLIL